MHTTGTLQQGSADQPSTMSEEQDDFIIPPAEMRSTLILLPG